MSWLPSFMPHVPTDEECKQYQQQRAYEDDMYNTKSGRYGKDIISDHVFKYWAQWVGKKNKVYVVVYECPLKKWNKKYSHSDADEFLGEVYDAVVSEVHGTYQFGRINGSTFALLTTSSSTKSAAKNVDFDDCGFGHKYEPEVSTQSWWWVQRERVQPRKGAISHDAKVGISKMGKDKKAMNAIKKQKDREDCIFIDIDHMSRINGKGKYKSHGNKVIDRVRHIVGKHGNNVMKVGGDEFRCTAKKGTGKSVANKIRREVKEKLRYKDGKTKVTVTLGVGRTPKQAQDAQEWGKEGGEKDEVHMYDDFE